MKLGIALLPEEDIMEAIVSLQHRLSEISPLRPELSLDNNLPHLTLMQGDLAEDWDGDRAIEEIADAIPAPVRSEFDYGEVYCQPPDWIFIPVRSGNYLQDLHHRAFRTMEAHLRSPEDVSPSGLSHYTPSERKYFQKYGYPYVAECFAPHVTLGRSVTGVAAIAATANALIAKDPLPPFIPARLTVYVMGKDGAHESIVAERSMRTSWNKSWAAGASRGC
jgi:2'-5' RNA ligase